MLSLSNCELNESQGSGYVIVNFARGLSARGHEVCQIGAKDLTLAPGLRKARQLRLALGMWLEAKRRVASGAWDIVEFYGGEAWLATLRLARMRRRKFAIVAHSNGIEPFLNEAVTSRGVFNTADGRAPKWYQGWTQSLTEHAFRRADAIVTVSHEEARFAVERGYQQAARVLAIDNALPDSFLGIPFSPERKRVVGFCGSWFPRKGSKIILADIPAFLRRFPDWEFQLVGVGQSVTPERDFPPDVASRIKVIPFISDKAELKRVYQGWAIAIMPSIYESFGLVAAEAMACGCALVAAPTGFGSSLQHMKDALVMADFHSPALEQALSQLASDEVLRTNIAGTGHQRVQSLRWSDAIDEYERFLSNVLERTRVPSKPSASHAGLEQA